MSNDNDDSVMPLHSKPSNGDGPGKSDYALVVENAHKRYGAFHAIRRVIFRIRNSSRFGVLGPNGAGKTSSLAMMQGLVPITSGKITALGFDAATRMDKIQPHGGVRLQRNKYHEFLTVNSRSVCG